jgi:hypothetical protein
VSEVNAGPGVDALAAMGASLDVRACVEGGVDADADVGAVASVCVGVEICAGVEGSAGTGSGTGRAVHKENLDWFRNIG